MSEFSFSDDPYNQMDAQQVEKSMSEFIDLTVPITYRVKFNFTPEKYVI